LGIGVPRAGTTWLYELLMSHPEVYVPSQRKEVHFFDRHYERGLQWYESFFPAEAQSHQYRAIGEITPSYLYCERCSERIADISSVNKLILILRNPVDRAYSYYWLRVRTDNYSGTFEDFLSSHPGVIRGGHYGQNLRHYLRYFREDQFLTLVYEHAFADLADTRNKVAHFLGVSPKLFPEVAGETRINRSYMPKLRFAYALATNIAEYLRERDLYWAISVAKRMGVRQAFGEDRRSIPPMKEKTRRNLESLYREEIIELESLMRIDLDSWKQSVETA